MAETPEKNISQEKSPQQEVESGDKDIQAFLKPYREALVSLTSDLERAGNDFDKVGTLLERINDKRSEAGSEASEKFHGLAFYKTSEEADKLDDEYISLVKQAEGQLQKVIKPETTQAFLKPYQEALASLTTDLERAGNDVDKIGNVLERIKEKRIEANNEAMEKFHGLAFYKTSEEADKLDDKYISLVEQAENQLQKARDVMGEKELTSHEAWEKYKQEYNEAHPGELNIGDMVFVLDDYILEAQVVLFIDRDIDSVETAPLENMDKFNDEMFQEMKEERVSGETADIIGLIDYYNDWVKHPESLYQLEKGVWIGKSDKDKIEKIGSNLQRNPASGKWEVSSESKSVENLETVGEERDEIDEIMEEAEKQIEQQKIELLGKINQASSLLDEIEDDPKNKTELLREYDQLFEEIEETATKLYSK